MKWSQYPESVEGGNFDTLVVALEPEDVEVLQSAEIIYRELRARGYKVLFDDRPLAAQVKRDDRGRFPNGWAVEIGHEGLSRDGCAELVELASGASESVRLEEVVEKLEEKCRRAPLA